MLKKKKTLSLGLQANTELKGEAVLQANLAPVLSCKRVH